MLQQLRMLQLFQEVRFYMHTPSIRWNTEYTAVQ